MKRLYVAILIVAPFLCGPAVQGDIVITEVMSSSAQGAGTSNGDWFELTNNGAATVNITGWSWDDDSNLAGTATFGAITSIAAGESILITQETLLQEAAWRTEHINPRLTVTVWVVPESTWAHPVLPCKRFPSRAH